jgi:hypothetical protein
MEKFRVSLEADERAGSTHVKFCELREAKEQISQAIERNTEALPPRSRPEIPGPGTAPPNRTTIQCPRTTPGKARRSAR